MLKAPLVLVEKGIRVLRAELLHCYKGLLMARLGLLHVIEQAGDRLARLVT